MEKWLLDTNVLMELKLKKGFLTLPVIQELDRLKTKEGETGRKARDAISYIYRNLTNFTYLNHPLEKDEEVDNFLLRTAFNYQLTLKTLDLSLFLRAKGEGIKADFLSSPNGHYTGTTYLKEHEWCALLEGKYTLPSGFSENHFFIYGKEARMIKNGKIEKINYLSLLDTYSGEIRPRNIEQYCLVELLSSEVPIVCGTGRMGSGKSYLMLNYALAQLKKEKINKLVFVPSNSYVKDSFDIAALPGGLVDKQVHLLGPLTDILGEIVISEMVSRGKIEIVPLAVMRGRSFNDSIIYVSEAQNLSESHIQLIIARLGENSRLFIDGDYQGQIDKKIFENKNGIRLLLNVAKTKEAELFGTVRLNKVERSRVAQLAEVLEEFK